MAVMMKVEIHFLAMEMKTKRKENHFLNLKMKMKAEFHLKKGFL